MPLDPDTKMVLDLMRAAGTPPIEQLSPEQARTMFQMTRPVLQQPPADVAETREMIAPGPRGDIPVRLYRGRGTADQAALPVLVFFHGGGWVIGDLDTYDGFCRDLANGAGCAVISVDYRLAPEHKFPAAPEDCIAATQWAASHAAELRIDPARMAVGGDSAGGNLAAVVALARRDTGGPALALQLLIYPSLDMNAEQESYRREAEGYLLTTAGMLWFRNHYIRTEADMQDWHASPLLVPDVRGVAPAFVATAAHDPLCDEGFAYARRLEAAGVRVAHLHLNDQMHGFITMGRAIRAATLATNACAGALQSAFARPPLLTM
jgi:acetyl esterase